MPSIRIGYSSEFVLRNELVGIGSTATSERLDVAGQIRSENTAGSGGVSTFREYQGFSQVEANITNNITIDNGSGGPYSSLTGEIKITGETTVSSGSTVEVGKTKTLTATDRFAVPLGETNNRDLAPEAGTTRFNQDFGTLEFFDGNNWKTVNSYARYYGGAAGRAIYAGGGRAASPGGTDHIEHITLSTLGNSISFGNLRQLERLFRGGSSETRGVFAPGDKFPTTMEYITLASGGESIQFDGSMPNGRGITSALSSSTRGLVGGGWDSPVAENHITYFEIAQLGSATDFGDLSQEKYGMGGMASPTRGIFAGGYTGSPNPTALAAGMDYITIASKGNGIDFGDPTTGHAYPADGSDGVRGIIAGGVGNYPSGQTPNDVIDYVNIGSLGNAVNFGNLTRAKRHACGASSKTRMVAFSGTTSVPSPDNSLLTDIDYIQISAGGAAQDFGELSVATFGAGSCSDSHGGLGGF